MYILNLLDFIIDKINIIKVLNLPQTVKFIALLYSKPDDGL